LALVFVVLKYLFSGWESGVEENELSNNSPTGVLAGLTLPCSILVSFQFWHDFVASRICYCSLIVVELLSLGMININLGQEASSGLICLNSFPSAN
jgi:hypothetical protein